MEGKDWKLPWKLAQAEAWIHTCSLRNVNLTHNLTVYTSTFMMNGAFYTFISSTV